MKKFSAAVLLALTTAGAVAASCGAYLPAHAAEEKTADIYILAGQSNAVGCSNLLQTARGETKTYAETIGADDARNKDGYDDVLYYGVTNVEAKTAEIPQTSLTPVKLGQGQSAQFMGPEVGMAKILSESHTEDHPAVIVKYAAGGVFLGDYNGMFGTSPYLFTIQYGNWASPTMIARWKQEGKKIHKNSGLMYNRFLEVLGRGLDAVRAKGYTPVIKGYVWMQGESDAEHKELSGDYGKNLKEFIEDLRKDTARISGDDGALHMPFVIGKVTPTYNGYTRWVETLRAGQDAVAGELPFVSTVETDDLPVVDMKTHETLGSDVCHFNAGDMYTLGKRFGAAAEAGIAKYAFTVTAGEGGSAQIKSVLSEGEAITVPFACDEGKELARVTCNGTDITSGVQIADGSFVWTPANVSALNEIVIEFRDAAVEPEPEPEKESGCSSFVGAGVAAGGIAVAAAAVLIVAKGRKKK